MTRLFSESFQSFPVMKSEAYLYGAHTASVKHGWVCQKHLHHMMIEINLVLEGEQIVMVDGRELRMQAGDLALIPPMLMHAFRTERPLRYFVLHVQVDDPVFFQLLSGARQMLFASSHELNRLILPAVHKLMEQLSSHATKIRLFHTLFEIMDHVEHFLLLNRDDADRGTIGLLPVRIAQQIEALVAAPLQGDDERLSVNWLTAIADKLGISRRHCHRVFQETYRMSPREYLAVLRQQEAMQLLLNDTGSIEQIALRIGYDNAQSFIRQFVKWTGLTPGAFRRQKEGDISYLTPLELNAPRDR
jgi:AraC-like DNA-binding protein